MRAEDIVRAEARERGAPFVRLGRGRYPIGVPGPYWLSASRQRVGACTRGSQDSLGI